MTQRFRITVRGLGVELRGRMDELTDEGAPTLAQFAEAMNPFGLVIASPAEDDFDPFGISEPEYPPTIEQSRQIIEDMMSVHDDQHSLLEAMAYMHFMQARVIRGERGRAERAEKELLLRELHHFEAEQENERLNNKHSEAAAIADDLESNWEQGDLAGAVNRAITYLREIGATE